MNILINGRPADITLDTEKNLGDVLVGVEEWLAPLGNRIRGVRVNGEEIPGDALSGIFNRDVNNTGNLEIEVSSWRELATEALSGLFETCRLYSDAAFGERERIKNEWEEGAAARFLKTDISDIFDMAANTLSGEGLSASELGTLVDERIRELADAAKEIANTEIPLNLVVQRMEELPLDIQTGKDGKAVETIQHFSRIGEKLFRIFFIFKSEGLSMDTFFIDELPARDFMEEFNGALKELSLACLNKDTVLMGDLAEYELAPRLRKFYSALKNLPELSASLVAAP